MIKEPEFFKWIKIRIGEPLTAVDMNESKSHNKFRNCGVRFYLRIHWSL